MGGSAERQAFLKQHSFAAQDAYFEARFFFALDDQTDRPVSERPEPFNTQ